MTTRPSIRRKLCRQAPFGLTALLLAGLALWSTGCICTDPRAGCTYIFRAVPYPAQTNEFADCTIVNDPRPCPVCLRFEDDGSFESGRMTWQGDQTRRVTRLERITSDDPPDHVLPCSYATMLQMLAATPTGPSDDFVGEVYQVIDLRGENLPAPAEVVANALATRVNLAFTDTQLGFTLEAYAGDPAVFPGGSPQLLATHTEPTHTNREPADWEWISAQMDLPDGTDFLVAYLQVFENARNETNEAEFYGHYFDAVRVGIGLRDPYDLHLSATPQPESARQGDTVAFTVSLTNDGPNDAPGTTTQVTLPEGLAYISHSGNGSFDPATGVWTAGPLSTGALTELVLSTTVTASVRTREPAILPLEARLTGGIERDPFSVNNTARALLTVYPRTAYDLELDRSLNAHTFTQGDTAHFVFTLTNHGPDTLFQFLEIDGGYGGGLGNLRFPSFSPAPFDPSFRPPTMPPDSSRTEIESALAVYPGTYTGIARIVSGLGDEDDPSNNADTLTYTILPTTAPNDLSLENRTRRTVVRTDETLFYKVLLRNTGPSLATDLVVQFQPPPGLAFNPSVVLEPFDTEYDLATHQWSIPYLPPGYFTELTYAYSSSRLTSGIHTLTAEVIGGLDRDMNTANNTLSATVTVLPATPFDLQITKSVTPSVIDVGMEALFTLILQNNGPGLAPQVTVRDTLPAGLTILEVTLFDPRSGYTGATDGKLNWYAPGLLAGTRDTLRIRVRADIPGAYTNTAYITDNNRTLDPVTGDTNPANNNSDAGLTVQGTLPYDLALTKAATATTSPLDMTAADVVAAGDTLTYTVTVTNNGPGPAGGAIVEDPLPAALTTNAPSRLLTPPAASQGSATFTNATGTVTWTLGALAAGASETLTITLRPDAAGGAGPFTNTATIIQGLGGDTNGGNNADGAPISVDLRPVARADTVTTGINTSFFIDVLANDDDPDGTLDPAAIFLPGGNVSDSGMATVFPPDDGTVEYSPFPGYTGTDTFRYVIRDDQGAASNEAVVTVIVQ